MTNNEHVENSAPDYFGQAEYQEAVHVDEGNDVRWLSVSLFIGSALSLMMGLFKLFVYSSPEGYDDPVNALVGGDAYNYIINGTHATAYFVVFGALLIAGFLAEILVAVRK